MNQGVNSLRIKDFADEKGLTKQAVYKAIQRAGFSTRQLTDRHGNITGKGYAVLRNLFPDDPETQDTPEEAAPQPQETVPEPEPELVLLRRRVEELENRCAEWEKRYFEAMDHSKKESEQMRVLLSQEQQLRLAAENKHFFRRLFAGKKAAE